MRPLIDDHIENIVNQLIVEKTLKIELIDALALDEVKQLAQVISAIRASLISSKSIEMISIDFNIFLVKSCADGELALSASEDESNHIVVDDKIESMTPANTDRLIEKLSYIFLVLPSRGLNLSGENNNNFFSAYPTPLLDKVSKLIATLPNLCSIVFGNGIVASSIEDIMHILNHFPRNCCIDLRDNIRWSSCTDDEKLAFFEVIKNASQFVLTDHQALIAAINQSQKPNFYDTMKSIFAPCRDGHPLLDIRVLSIIHEMQARSLGEECVALAAYDEKDDAESGAVAEYDAGLPQYSL